MKTFFLTLAVAVLCLVPSLAPAADPGSGGRVVAEAVSAPLDAPLFAALPDLAPWRGAIVVALLALAALTALGAFYARLQRTGYLARLTLRRCVHAVHTWSSGGLPQGRWALVLGAVALCAMLGLSAAGVSGAALLLPCIVLGSVYALPAIADEDLDMAISASVGAESRVFVSYDDIKNVADLEQTVAGTGTANTDNASLVHDGSRLKSDRTFRAPSTTTEGYDLALVCNGPIRSTVGVEVKLNVTLNNVAGDITSNTIAAGTVITTTAAHGLTSNDTVNIPTNNSSVPTIVGTHVITVLSTTTFSIPITTTTGGTGGTFTSVARNGTATATIVPPETAQDQSFNFPQGLSVDFTPSVTGATVRSVVSVEEITGGGPGNKFGIVSFPASTSFTEVACATDKSFDPPTPQSVSIACRYNPNRWVKRGRGKEQKVDLKAKYASFGDGLPRINGQRVTLMLELWKDDAILVERVFFGGWRAEVSINHGDGDSESEASATGKFEVFAFFN